MMGSNILLESEPGRGEASLVFPFPCPSVKAWKMRLRMRQKFLFEGRHVLVVEDNELNAEIAQSPLEERNFHVDYVSHGEAQAVERIRTTQTGNL